MARPPAEGLQNDIKVLLHQNPKGLSIEEVATHLTISRTTAIKYLSAMEQTGLVESRPYGPAKIFSLAERISIENFVSLLPHLILILDDHLVIKQVNDALLEFFHLDKSSIIGREIRYSSLGSYVNESRLELLERALHGVPQIVEEDLTFEGKKYIFLIRIIPIIFEQGTKGVFLTFEDITTLKEYQEHLEEIVKERTSELSSVNIELLSEIQKNQDICHQYEQSQTQYQQLVESSTDIILKFSAQDTLIYHNQLAEKTLGIGLSNRRKYHFLGTCIPNKKEHREYAQSLISELLSDSSIIRRAEFEYPSPYPLWISWTFHSITSLTSGELEILCVGTEITDHILAEKRLKESEEHLTRILAHLPDPTFVINTERKVIFWNQAMKDMTGVPAEFIIGKERAFFTPSIFGFSRPVLADLIFEPDNQHIKEFFRDLSIDESSLTAETSGIGKDGKERIFWSKATPLKDESGTITAAIQSLRDITSIRRMEEILEESECRARGILEASKDLIVVINSQKTVVYSNPSYSRLTGHDSVSLKGLSIYQALLPGDAEEWERLICSSMQTKLSNRVEMPAHIGDRDIMLDAYLIPFYPQKSEDLHILIDMRDITVMKMSGSPLWDEEGTLQEIGKKVSRIIPHITLGNVISPMFVISILLLAFTGNYM